MKATAALLLASAFLVQEGKPDEKKPPGPLRAIAGGWVLPVSGPPIHRGVVLFRDGKIVDVGPELAIPPGAEVHRADGKYVCPGFVAVEASRVGHSGAPGRIADGLDPYQRDLRIALASGITTAHVVESGFGGFFGGDSPVPFSTATAVIKCAAGDLDSMLLREPAANYFSFRRGPLDTFQLRDRFRRASEHIRSVSEAERSKQKPPSMPADLERYVRILKNETPTIVVADSVEEVRTILAIRREHPFDLVFSGADGGWRIAREISAAFVPVLTKVRGRDMNFDFTSPAVPEDGVIPIRRAAAFAQAGIPVAILPHRRSVSLDGLAGRDLTALALDAAFAVRGGLDEATALGAITLEPARILRIDGRVGSLDRGKDADILILSRHPLDYRSGVETVFINGKIYYERAKSPLFREIPLR